MCGRVSGGTRHQRISHIHAMNRRFDVCVQTITDDILPLSREYPGPEEPLKLFAYEQVQSMQGEFLNPEPPEQAHKVIA